MPTRSQVNTSINTKLASGSDITATELREVALEQLDYVDQQDALKVDKEAGKGLSTNDYTTTEKNKLTAIATGATANSSDATLLNRANHTGTQTSATISDLTEYIQDTIATMLGAGSNVILTYNDAAGTLEVSATGSGGAGLDTEQVRDAIGVALVGVGNIAVTVNDAADTITISTTATQNSTDAALRDRSTHTGTQTASTISDFATAVNALLTGYATTSQLTTGLAGKANTTHSHAVADVTGLQTALDGKQASGDYATSTALTSGLAGKANASHTHAATDITEDATHRFVTDAEKSTWNAGGAVFQSIAYTTSIPFTHAVTKIADHALVGDITLTPNTVGAVPGATAIIRITANGTNTVDVSAFKSQYPSGDFLNINGIVNRFLFYYDGTDYVVSINQNYDALSGGYDIDAAQWFAKVTDRGGTLSTSQKNVINAFITGIKADGIYELLTEFGIMIGGTNGAHSIGFKSFRDLTFMGTWTHAAAGGSLSSGTSAYAKTNIIPSNHLSLNNVALSYYSLTNDSNLGDDLSGQNNSNQIFRIMVGNSGTFRGQIGSGSQEATVGTANTLGLHSVIRSSGTLITLYQRGASVATNTTANTGTLPTVELQLNALNNAGTTIVHSNRKCLFWAVGLSRTGTQELALHNRLETLKTALGL